MRIKGKRAKAALILLCTFIILVVCYARNNVSKVMIEISEATMRSITTVAVNDAIYYTLSDNLRYEDLVQIIRDEDGNILAITSNALQINRIARDAAYLSQENLDKMSEAGIDVPLGALTGSKSLAGFGPKINIKIIPISNVECKFVSDFKSCGVNQTLHSVYLEIVADISIIMPTHTSNLASKTEVLICESVLVGKVPEFFMQSDIFSGSSQKNV